MQMSLILFLTVIVMEFVSNENYARRNGICKHFPFGYVFCENYYLCEHCEFAHRLRVSRPANIPLFDWRDALPQTPSYNAENWYRKPVILSPDALRRLGIECRAINQIIIAMDGPGVFKKNVSGEIDGVLLSDRQRHIIVIRSECYGIPSRKTAERFDELFYLGLLKFYDSKSIRG